MTAPAAPTGDITLIFDPVTCTFDFGIDPGGYDIATGNDLETAVAICLFTDARADPDFVPPDGSGDLRGWWGDTYSPTPWGSLLWTFDRAAISDQQETLRGIERAAVTALQPLVTDSVIATATATASYLGQGVVELVVQVTQPGSNQPQTFKWAWDTVT
jgi:phage gp46-like protein